MPIERDLRGKRFFITGATGFLGTALVERILRCVPEAEITVLIRPGRRADAGARLAREVIKNDCFDRLRSELGDGFDDEVARRVRAVAGDVGQDGLGLDEEGREALAEAERGHPLGRHGLLRRPADPGRRDQPARPVTRRRRHGRGRVGRPPRSRCRPPTWPARTRARPRRSCSARTASASTSAGRTRSPRPGGCATTSRPSRANPRGCSEFTKKARAEIGAAGDHLIAAEGREAPRGVGQRRARQGGHGPGPVARVARRLPLHQGAR